jgi:hypothetical protein
VVRTERVDLLAHRVEHLRIVVVVDDAGDQIADLPERIQATDVDYDTKPDEWLA